MTELARIRPESFFADRFNVTSSLLERVLGGSLLGRVDDADIYLEYRVNEELQLEEGTVKKASRHVSQGAGVRALSGTRTGYAHTDDTSLPNLEEAASQARAIADRAGASGAVAVRPRGRPHAHYTLPGPPVVTDLARKLDLLRKVDDAARAADPRVTHVIASLSSEEVVTLVATASGWTVGDVRPLTRLNVTAIAEENGRRETGGWGGGGRVALAFYLEQERRPGVARGARDTGGRGGDESSAHPPMPRMTNTFMVAGEEAPEEIIGSVRRGLYAVTFGGGQVDITNGKFVFSASEAYLIEDGRVTAPVKGATLIGNGPDALTRVARVGRDLKFDEGVGTCGKEGQSVPVCVWLPTIRN